MWRSFGTVGGWCRGEDGVTSRICGERGLFLHRVREAVGWVKGIGTLGLEGTMA